MTSSLDAFILTALYVHIPYPPRTSGDGPGRASKAHQKAPQLLDKVDKDRTGLIYISNPFSSFHLLISTPPARK